MWAARPDLLSFRGVSVAAAGAPQNYCRNVLLFAEAWDREGGIAVFKIICQCVIGCRQRRVVHTICEAGAGPGVKRDIVGRR